MVMKITRSLLLSLNMNKELLINRHTNVVTQFCEDSEFSGAKWTLNGCRSNSISCIYDESILPTDYYIDE
jgi:hypothetical protein